MGSTGSGFPRSFFYVALFLLCSEARAQTTLRWKFQKGQTLYYSLDTTITQSMSSRGRNVGADQKQTIDMVWKVKEVDGDGTALVEQSISRIQFTMKSAAGISRYDTRDGKATDPAGEVLKQFFDNLVNAKFELKMSPLGHISEFEDVEKLLQRIDKVPSFSKMGGIFSGSGLKRMITQGSLPLPAETVSAGKIWKKRVQFQMPYGKQTMEATYTFEEVKSGNAKIAVSHDIAIDASNSPANVRIESQIGEGEIEFDIEAGHMRTYRMKQKIDLVFEVGVRTIANQVVSEVQMRRTISPE